MQYKLIKKIKDERFDEDQLDHYTLIFQPGVRDFQVCVVDSRDERVLLLEDYILPAATSSSEWIDLLDDIFDSHHSLKANFWKSIRVGIKNPKFSLIPSELFSGEALEKYLRYNAPIDEQKDQLTFNKSGLSEVVTVFSYDKKLGDFLNGIYPNNTPTFFHQGAALIEGALAVSAARKDHPLYAYIDRFKLHLISCQHGKLIYYNQFIIHQFADYVKYIMMVMKTLKMDQQSGQIVLWGYLGKNSPHYHEFYKYIKNVSFGGRPADFRFGYMFDEIQEHHFFDLYNVYRLP